MTGYRRSQMHEPRSRVDWHAMNVSINDLAATGAAPRWFLASLLLPEGSQPELAERIFTQIGEACERFQICVVGGHTEITAGLGRPIVVGCLLGEVAREKLVITGGAQAGGGVLLG